MTAEQERARLIAARVWILIAYTPGLTGDVPFPGERPDPCDHAITRTVWVIQAAVEVDAGLARMVLHAAGELLHLHDPDGLIAMLHSMPEAARLLPDEDDIRWLADYRATRGDVFAALNEDPA